MKYKCLVFDHDDTVVNSTATIHHPCFVEYLEKYYPGETMSLEDYFRLNFHPGFVPMCIERYKMTDADLEQEGNYWKEYVTHHIPKVYPGIKEIMERQRAEGGLICVVSHSFDENILRDYEANGLPVPDAVYGWERPVEQRKPYPFPLLDIMERFGLQKEELLMIDDLKPGYDMAMSCGVDFAAVGWSNDIPEIESFMRENCALYFKTVDALSEYVK